MSRYMCMDTLRFMLFDVHNLPSLFEYERYNSFDKDAASILLDATKSWADQRFYPCFREMDEHPAHYKDGKVRTHPVLPDIFREAGENGWLASYFNHEDGGMQISFTLHSAASHILQAANNHIPGYLGLTSGAAHLIASFGAAELKERFIPNMLSGKWAGTMALTEPQAGSSLSDITTTAYPTQHGHYTIKGQKIFISGGDQEATENIIHLTLARIEGAPPGTRGISLFVVPAFREDTQGDLISNDVCAVADFQKLGQRGYSTVHLVYGEQNDCRGYLVGAPHQGLKYMFQMMNGARIDVGLTAASTATAAYYASLQYAKERPQGRRLGQTGSKDVETPQIPIIRHADVRRMLWRQKAITEGSLSLLLFCSMLNDKVHCETGEAKEEAQLLLELLTPVAKTYPAEMGFEAVSTGLQVLGGYGFCMDFPLQQYLRDIRIMSIYEGTTGIQSLDLLGRKVTMENGKALIMLSKIIQETIREAASDEELKGYCQTLATKMEDVTKALNHLMPHAMKGDYETYLADAAIFMDMFSHVVLGWQWLTMAIVAKNHLNAPSVIYDTAFYKAKVHTMKYFFSYELPKVGACLETILKSEKLTIPNTDYDAFF
jgi:alkylation response protein AidB-like acyl-CoA dehydrogenase